MLRQSLVVGIWAIGLSPWLCAQEPPLADPKPQVEARGPLHEAYAQIVSKDPVTPPAAPRQPPEPVPEEPPEQKPAGENVQWIPGYWQWDDERKDFIWVSGFWREAPQGRRWVPGYWVETPEGWRWVSGHWAAAPEADRQYVPEPPPNIDEGPSTPPPDENSFYVPGCWFYTETGYRWRPGYWADVRPDFVWVPASYVWSPRGYFFCSGYWDYIPARRGLLFAPVYWGPRPFFPLGFVYRPSFLLATDVVFGSLFLRPGFRCYYFGDFYGPAYWGLGYRPWFGPGLNINIGLFPGLWGVGLGTGLAWGLGWGTGIGWRAGFGWGVGIGFGGGWGGGWLYDPLFVHQCWVHRNNRAWILNQQQTFLARITGREAPPPRTLEAQLVSANAPAIVRPLSQAATAGLRLETLAESQRQNLAENARRLTARSLEASRIERPDLPVPPPRPTPSNGSSVRLDGSQRLGNRPTAPSVPNVPDLRDRLGTRVPNQVGGGGAADLPSTPARIANPGISRRPSASNPSNPPGNAAVPTPSPGGTTNRSVPTPPSLPTPPTLGERLPSARAINPPSLPTPQTPGIGGRTNPPVDLNSNRPGIGIAPSPASRPSLPSVPNLSTRPSVPSTPNLGGAARPSVPSMPNLGGAARPSVPSMPNLGGAARPSVPSMPNLGGAARPSVPSMPSVPNIGGGGGSRGGIRR